MEILQEYGNCHECSMKLNPEILYFVNLAYFDERKEIVRKWSWLWESRVMRKPRLMNMSQMRAYRFVLEKCLFIHLFSFLLLLSSSLLAKKRLSANYECANESLSTRESFERELRWFCLALMRFYTKIKQIRTLDFVEVVYY